MEEPQIVGEGDAAWAFLKLMTSYTQRNPDGSYEDVEQIVPIVADVPHHVNTAKKYIKAGKAMTVDAYYRSWESNGPQHGFFVKRFIFAKANWGAENRQQPGMPQ